jgi:DNA-directed RNA polymerase subunit H (RpoH/RPB5)
MSFQILKDFNEEAEYIQGSEEDVDYNQNLKAISQLYLLENGFSLGKEKLVEDMSKEEFVKMMEERSEDEDNQLIQRFEKYNIEVNLRTLMSNIYEGKDGKNIFVFFIPTGNSKSVGINFISMFYYLLISLDCKIGLLVSKKPLTPESMKKIHAVNVYPEDDKEIYNIDYYIDQNFLPLCKHSLIPKVLKIYRYPEEVKNFMKENDDVDVSKFPRMILSDPLVKFYRGKSRDIFMLERKNINEKNILSTQIIYRVVVNSTMNKATKK